MIVICIPIYKTELDWYETVSLNQAMNIFGDKYDICFCVPESIKDFYVDRYGDDVIINAFPNPYFTSIRSYSELCLYKDFYKHFEKYEYMLLYQLDAFVFRDDLMQLCELDYDYIGADTCDGRDWNLINETVGNGGLSLRKISSFYKILSEQPQLLKEHPLRGTFNSIEDVFWGYCGHRKDLNFRTPNIDIANRFAITFGTEFFVNKDDLSTLPFGTHAWNRFDYDIWKPIIEQYGFELARCEDVEYKKTSDTYLIANKYRSLMTKIKIDKVKNVNISKCSIWGAGYNGIRCIRLLNQMGVNINHVYDWNIHALDGVVDVIAPDIELPTCLNLANVKDEELLIISTKPDSEIIGKIKDRNYMLYDDFLSQLNIKVWSMDVNHE